MVESSRSTNLLLNGLMTGCIGWRSKEYTEGYQINRLLIFHHLNFELLGNPSCENYQVSLVEGAGQNLSLARLVCFDEATSTLLTHSTFPPRHNRATQSLEGSKTMADNLIDSLERVKLNDTDHLADDWIDQILDQRQPRKRVKQDSEALKKELEQKYLTPSSTFSTEWLNKLQQSVLPLLVKLQN